MTLVNDFLGGGEGVSETICSSDITIKTVLMLSSASSFRVNVS